MFYCSELLFLILANFTYTTLLYTSIGSRKKNDKNFLEKDTFLQANLFSRFMIVLSGPLANLILGLLLITSLYFFNGRYVSPPIINDVLEAKPAKIAGIISGDKIISINDKKIKNFSDVKNIFNDLISL